MSTENPNIFANPANSVGPSLFSQYNQSGAMITPGQTAIANFRARGGRPVGGPSLMNAQPNTQQQDVIGQAQQLQQQNNMLGQVQGGQTGQPSVMPAQNTNMAPPQAGPMGPPQGMPAPIRPPSAGFLRPRSPVNPAASISMRAGPQPAISRY